MSKREFSKKDLKQRLKRASLTPQQRAALLSLQQRNDIIINPADEGEAVVVCARHLCIEEPERQFSDNNFDQQEDRNYTIDMTTWLAG